MEMRRLHPMMVERNEDGTGWINNYASRRFQPATDRDRQLADMHTRLVWMEEMMEWLNIIAPSSIMDIPGWVRDMVVNTFWRVRDNYYQASRRYMDLRRGHPLPLRTEWVEDTLRPTIRSIGPAIQTIRPEDVPNLTRYGTHAEEWRSQWETISRDEVGSMRGMEGFITGTANEGHDTTPLTMDRLRDALRNLTRRYGYSDIV